MKYLSLTGKVFGVIFLGVLAWILILDWWRSSAEQLDPYRCPYFFTSGSIHGQIHLPVGTIFGYPAKSGENLYDIIRDDTFIMSAYFMESFKKDFKCFETEEEAVAMGYKKFLSDQASQKKRRLEAEERLNKPQEERKNATDTTEILRDIDAVIGL